MSSLSKLIASTAKLTAERSEYDERIARNKRMRNGYDNDAEFPDFTERGVKYEYFDGKTCTNPNCRSRLYPDTVIAHFLEMGGFKCCTVCATQQQGSQVMVQAEERRTFSDDRERGIDRDRTELVRDDETGTGASSVPASMQYAARCADAKGGVNCAIQSRQTRYVKSLRELAAQIVTFRSVMLESAVRDAKQLARAIDEHRKCCSEHNCYLNNTPRDPYCIAAALVYKVAKEYQQGLLFSELEMHLEGIGHWSSEQHVRRAHDVVVKLISGYNMAAFPCTTAEIHVKAAESAESAESAEYAMMLARYLKTVQRMCEIVGLPFATQSRAEKVVTDWCNAGVKGGSLKATAGAAIWSVVKDEGVNIEQIAKAIQYAPETIKRELAKYA